MVASAWQQWLAIEFWRYIVIAAAFLVAAIGSTFAGPYRWYFCAIFYAAGLALLFGALQWLSLVEWAFIESLAADVSFIAPTLVSDVVQGYEYFRTSLGPLWMAVAQLAGLSIVVMAGIASRSLIRDQVDEFQGQLQSAFLGQVDPVFPRADWAKARACAEARRKAIRAYLNQGVLPPRTHKQVSFSNGHSPFRFVREYVERRQEVQEVNPLRVAAFLEVPRGSPIEMQPLTLDSIEEVAGQYVRLAFECEQAPPSDWPMPWDAPDDALMLLLGRVVDAAILADQHLDAQRDDTTWNAMPFFERIYLDYRPIPGPLKCFLGPILGDVVPARVVIETHYPDVFRKALHGGKGKYGQFRNWFGIGIQIEAPNLPQGYLSRLTRVLGGVTPAVNVARKPWFNAEPPCRRLKSRVRGGVSGELTVRLSAPIAPNQGTLESEGLVHVVSCGPVADGCRSVVSSAPTEPPIVARGAVSNAPAVWLLPRRGDLHPTCKGTCVRSTPPDPAEISIDLANVGTVKRAQSGISRLLAGPPAVGWVRGRAWVGAFFDRDLRIANRFPLLACSKVLGGGSHADFRGAFIRSVRERVFGGVFVSVLGPEHAPNLLLPEPLLNDYLTHLPVAGDLADTLPQVEQPPFLPAPAVKGAR